jgi:type I restriction enzyme S subunit
MSEDATLDEFGSETNSEKQQKSSNWVRQSITEISEWTDAGGTPRTSNDAYWGGDISWVQTGELTKRHISSTEKNITKLGLKESTAKRFPSGTLLIGMYGEPTVGESALLETEATTNQACCGIFPNTDVVNAEFLHQMMQYEKPRLYSLRAGSGQQNIRQETIRKFEIGIPPLSEQRKIATVLHTVDQAIQKSREVAERLEIIKKGIKQDILTTGLDNSPTRDVRIVSQEVGISSQWEVVPLPEIAKSGENTFTDGDWVESSDMVEDGEYQLIQLGNIGEGRFKGGCNRYVNQEFFEEENCTLVEEGDLLISRMAEPILRTLIVPEFDRKSITAVDIVVAKIDESVWDKRYINYLLNSKAWENIAEALASGSTRKRISRENMSRILIPKPGLESQEKIADIVESIENQATAEREQIKQLQRLKQGLMQDLLSGKVRTTDVDIDIPEEVAKYG